jgi:hypothetical protein
MTAKYPEAMIADPERVTSYIGRYGNAIETVEGANIASLLLTSLNAISCDRMREGILRALLGPEDPDFCTELCSEEPVDASPSDALRCERPDAGPPTTPVHEKKSTRRIQSKKSKLVRFKSSPCSFTVNKTAVSVKVGVTTSPIHNALTQASASSTATEDVIPTERNSSRREIQDRYCFRATSILKAPKYRQWGV